MALARGGQPLRLQPPRPATASAPLSRLVAWRVFLQRDETGAGSASSILSAANVPVSAQAAAGASASFLAVVKRAGRRRCAGRSAQERPGQGVTEDHSHASGLGYALLFVVVPLVGYALFPALVALCRSSTSATSFWCLSVYVARRAYLYVLAVLGVFVASRRSVRLPEQLGNRLEGLTEELLRLGSVPDWLREENEKSPSLKQLDGVGESQLAVALPVLLGLALAVSATMLSTTQDAAVGSPLASVTATASALLPGLVLLSNATFCTLATKVELSEAFSRSGLPGSGASRFQRDLLALLTAVGLVGASFLLPLEVVWPVHNIVNICAVVAGARAFALPRLQPILLLLLGVCIYDVVGTLGPLLLSLSSGGATTGAAAAGSAMERVALAKVGLGGVGASTSALPTWRPGLLEVVLTGRVSDVLGLADLVFPAVLLGWAVREDLKAEAQGGGAGVSYASAALLGYVAGCAACEVAGPLLELPGLPALAFLVPLMVGSVVAVAGSRGELMRVWEEQQ